MKRVIVLVDMNAFYLMCELTRRPDLIGQAAAVAGDPQKRTGIILTAGYEARACGVRTAMTVSEALKRCPDLMLIKPDHAFYEEKSEQVMTLLSEFSPLLEQNSIDEAWLDLTACQWLYQSPGQAACLIQQALEDRLGLPCSIGLSDNKYLAKMASGMKKPRGITELWPAQVAEKLWPLPVGALHGVGRKTRQSLQQLGIQTVGDLAALEESYLIQKLGKTGAALHRHAQGIDNDPVVPRRADQAKSVGRSTTFAKDLTDRLAVDRVLMQLSDDIGQTVRQQGRKGQLVQLTLRDKAFRTITRQTPLPATASTHEIYDAARKLLEKNWVDRRPLRLIGVSLSQFEQTGSGQQLSLFDLDDQNAAAECGPIDQVLDAIRERHGPGCVGYGRSLEPPEPQEST